MYCTLDAIDLVTADRGGGATAVLTDHRTRAEIDGELDMAIVFALSRALRARAFLTAEGRAVTAVVYVAADEPPPALRDALAAADVALEVRPGPRRSLGPAGATVDAIADRSFGAIAAAVARRTGLTDPAAVLRVLEAETLADRPDREADEAGYWTRVVELMAATVAVLRTKHAGTWIATDHSVVPFGFALGPDHHVLPVNRAMRFLVDGEASSMFDLIAGTEETLGRATATEPVGPLLPNLRSRDSAVANHLAWRPLLAGVADAPVVVYGNDGEHTISWIVAPADADRLERAHAEALANLRAIEVEVVELTVAGATLCMVGEHYFATEKLLDVTFMAALHRRLRSDELVVGLPGRWLMIVAAATDASTLAAVVVAHHAQAGTSAITTTLLGVRDGVVIGVVPPDGDEPPPAEPEPAPSPKSFWRKLFRR